MGNTPVMRPQLKGAEGSLAPWRVAVTAAVLGWLLACLLLALGTWPLGIVVALALTVAAASLHARRTARPSAQARAFTLAAIMLSWPPLGAVTLLVASWAGWVTWH
jgi:uncharacterized membrane protein